MTKPIRQRDSDSSPRSSKLMRAAASALWLALSLCCGLGMPASALAQQHSVAVLALAGEGIDAKLPFDLTEALRDEVEGSDGVSLSHTRASLDQLSMTQDCDVANESCLALIAKQLKVDAFIYGALTRTAHGVDAKLSLFDNASQSIQKTATASFSKSNAGIAEIKDQARSLADELLGRKHAVIRDAVLPIDSAEPAADGVSADAEVAPEAQSEAPAAAPAATSNSLSPERIAGYALLGTAVASAGLSVLSFVQVDRAGNNHDYSDYRKAVGEAKPNVKDVCAEADANRSYGVDRKSFGTVRDTCSTGKTYEALQFVFIGLALATGGLSAYFLLDEDSSKSEHARNNTGKALSFKPSIGWGSASLSARLKF